LGLKGIKKKVKAFLYVLFSGFLGIFGFANLAPNPKGKEPGASRSVRAPAFWKPTPQKRKKHTNLHKCKAKGKRNRKLKRSK
jgi:hypothetical protein